jgi:hypothetical protein
MDRTLSDLLAGLERAAADVQPSTIATLLGDLERLKALLWHRLTVTAATVPATPPTDGLEELRHLTPRQVGELLNVKPAYVHELCRTARIPALKSGKYWMIPLAGLRQWVMYQKGDIDQPPPGSLESVHPIGDTGRAVRTRPGRQS